MSMSIKLMGVPGPKLLDDEQFTQDMFGVSPPTFVTPDTRANAQLQHWSLKNASPFYFVELRATRTSSTRSCSCSGRRRSRARSRATTSAASRTCSARGRRCSTRSPRAGRSARACRACRAARPTTTCATRWSRRSREEDVEFDIRLQLQTDPFLMPIENNAVLWPTKLSPRVPAAVLRIPRQTFDSPEQLDFARVLSYNPWHSIAEHRPLGNQNRARKRMYYELSRLRQQMNARRALRADGRRGVPRLVAHPGQVAHAPRGRAGRSTRRPRTETKRGTSVHALADAVGRDRERPAERRRRRRRAGRRRRRARRTSGCSARCG